MGELYNASYMSYISDLIGKIHEDQEYIEKVITDKKLNKIESMFILAVFPPMTGPYFSEEDSCIYGTKNDNAGAYVFGHLGNLVFAFHKQYGGNGGNIQIIPQHPVLNYRLDFAFIYGEKKYAIEIDGHDWHEKTKEQASHDKKRDRDLLAAGWNTIRFTGSDVYRDPIQCWIDVMDIIIGGDE